MVAAGAGLGPLVLASASPRREAILRSLGFSFTIDPADVDETPPPGLDPAAVAEILARRKAEVVARRHPTAVTIGADTIVALGDRMLGKPEDADDARAILGALSGTTHRVITGVCLIHGPSGRMLSGAETTAVTMRPLSPDEIDDYVASGECFGKAGAYAIQERADRFVTELRGPYDNVVGFPGGLFRRLLDELSRSAAQAGGVP